MKAKLLLLAAGLTAAASATHAQTGKTLAPTAMAADNNSPALGGGYDGSWTFEATTTSGNCPTVTPISVVVQAGHVVSANNGASTPWGYVEPDGTFVARFTDVNGHVARASGRLNAASGTGAWSSSTDFCGGAWRARRGDAGKAAR